MHKKLVLLLGLVLLLSSLVHASFTVNLEPAADGTNQIYRDETAYYTLTIRNTGSSTDRFLVYTLDPSWIITTNPTRVEVGPGRTELFEIQVNPTSAVTRSGIYSINLEVKSVNSNILRSIERPLTIKSDAHREFLPAVSTTVQIGEDNIVDPREGIPVRLRLNNRNPLNLEKLDIFLESQYIQDTFSVGIAPTGEIIRQFNYPIDPYTPPGMDTLAVKIYYGQQLLSDRRFEFYIQENQLFFTRKVTEDSKFLYRDYVVNLTNFGNVPSAEVFTYDISRVRNWFTRTDPSGRYSDGQLHFDVSLDPAEVKTITIVTNYRPFVFTVTFIILLLAVLITAYYLFRSPILVSKRAEVVAERDGGTSEIKILLNIRNRTNKVLENIKVIDRIPDITEIEKEFSVGTLKPSKIVRHSKKGTLIRWDFPSVDGYEERIISYRIHSKLGIVGNLVLPSAVVRFTTPRGIARKAKSE